MLHFRKQGAFTLIELLIVVAIIAILAAIAVPNFLEAQTRAKVSRAKSDMRTLATALESYYVDNNNYAPSAEVDSDAEANKAFLSATVVNEVVLAACKYWASNEKSWDPTVGNSDPGPMEDFRDDFSQYDDKDLIGESFMSTNTNNDYWVNRPQKWGGNSWYDSNDGLSIPVGGSGFVALSTPISYISNPLLADPWKPSGAEYVKYVACNKFMPIGFSGGAESYATSKTGGMHKMYNNQNPQSGDVAPASTGDADPAFDANEDSQILWWALYCVGPDKTDSVVVYNGSDDVRQKMMEMWVAKSDATDPSIEKMVGAHVYDPTNGTKSGGEIWRLGGGRPSENASNSDGTEFDDSYNYSATPLIYQHLSQMVD